MTTNYEGVEMPRVPSFDLADRLRKALRESDVSVQDMADYLEVGRNTVGRWINGHNEPSAAHVKLWALRTGVPYAWLRDGQMQNPRPVGPDGGSELVRPEGLEPPTFWFGASGEDAQVIELRPASADEAAAA